MSVGRQDRERDRETQRQRDRDGASTQLAAPLSMKAGEQVGPGVWVWMGPSGWGAEQPWEPKDG